MMRKTYLLTFLLAAGLMAESPFAAYAKRQSVNAAGIYGNLSAGAI